MNKYGQEILTIDDWAELAYRNGDYEEATFLNEAVNEWTHDIEDGDNRYKEQERYADELFVGMNHLYRLVEALEELINQSQRINRKEVLERLKEIKQDFTEYI